MGKIAQSRLLRMWVDIGVFCAHLDGPELVRRLSVICVSETLTDECYSNQGRHAIRLGFSRRVGASPYRIGATRRVHICGMEIRSFALVSECVTMAMRVSDTILSTERDPLFRIPSSSLVKRRTLY
jgi:hypothetical protein